MSQRSFVSLRRILLCTASLAAAAGVALAQDAASSGKVEKITVTAQKRAQNAQDIPSTVNALTAKNIKDLGINSSDKIAEFVPGVTIALPSGQGNQPIVAIRGVGNNDFNTNNAGPNGIYSDEVYLSAPSSQTFLTFDLDRIEVLKGPQGTLYGRNTSGGAINFITNKPGDAFETGLIATYGTFNTWTAEGFINAPTGDNSAARLSGFWNTSDGYMRNLLNGERVSGTDGFALRAQWLVKAAEGFDILFNLHESKTDTLPTEYHHVGALDPLTFGPCTQAQINAYECVDAFGYQGPQDRYKGNYNRTEHLDNESSGGSVRGDYDFGSMTLTSISAFESNDKLHPEETDAGPLRLVETDWGVKSDTFTQELRLAGEGETLHWLVGLYYLDETLKQNQSIDILHSLDEVFGVPGAGDCPAIINLTTPFCAFTGASRSNQETTAYAVFGQTDFEIFERTRLTLGGRFTSESRDFRLTGVIIGQSGGDGNFAPPQELWTGGFDDSIDKSAFSWKAAIDHRLSEKVMAYASFSTGFKSGGFNGGFLDVNEVLATSQAAPVRSETNTAYEVGLKADLFDDTFRLNVSAFHYDYKDMQLHTLVQSGGFPVDVLDNAQKATFKGVDVEAVAKPVENLTVRLTAEWLEAKLDEFISFRGDGVSPPPDFSGNTVPNAPEFSFTGITEYTIPLGGGDAIDLIASASYRTEVFFDPSNDPLIVQGSYWVVDARAAYTIDDGRWQLAVFGRNLTDEEYLNMAFNLQSSFGLLQEIVAPPLTVGVEASFHY